MAYTQVVTDSAEVASERALATAHTSSAVRSGDVERVNYGGRTVEIAKIDHAALGRPVDKQYERNLASVQGRLNAIGVMTATVINFLPIPLVSDSCIDLLKPTKARILPPKDGEDFSSYVFGEAFIEPSRMGVDSPLIAVDWHPIQLAQEFSRINPKGVMTFIGIPSDVTREDWRRRISPEQQHNGRTYGQVFDDTRAAAILYMQEKLRSGNEDDRLKRNPSEPAKASARRLKQLGLIKNFPNWVEKQYDVTAVIPTCPQCQRPCEVGAVSCTNPGCGGLRGAYILNPRKAYEINAIDESDLSLERLTRAEVEEMGISDYVAETSDEKPLRLKRGEAKPISVAAQRLQDATVEQQEALGKANAASIGKEIAKNLPKPAAAAKNEKAEKES